MAGAVIVQVLFREATAGRGDRRGSRDIAIHQKGAMVGVGPEGFQNIFAARHHLEMVVGGDVEGE